MSTLLFHSSLSLSTPSRAIMYDEALKLYKEGYQIKLLYCGGLLTQCFTNICGDRSLCSICKSYYRSDLKILKDKVEAISMADIITDEQKELVKSLKFEYYNLDDLKNISYGNINIGMGVVSNYLSVSRNLTPLIDDDAKVFFNECLRNAILATIAFEETIDKYSPQEIFLFNGRLADSRPIRELAVDKNIPYTTLEAIFGINKKYKSKFKNSIPHSISYRTQLINDFWESDFESLEQKMKVGSSFFINRRNAKYSGDKIYITGQEQDLLPNNWDKDKHNIVIFNSSEDEFAAIGDEFADKSLFASQLEGLKYIKELLKNDSSINVTLRIHPNLSNIQYNYATELFSLQTENFTVIEGDSPIGSYALLDAADSIVVFGSTMGIESVFWKKPTILLAGAMYYSLDCCYIPKTKDELIGLLKSKLEPKDQLAAIKYGYHIMTEYNWESPSELDFNWTDLNIRLGKYTQEVQINNWQKVAGSKILGSIFRHSKNLFIKLFHKYIYRKKPLLKIPLKEM